MRHGKKINHLGRKSAHRQALLSNMAASLILHKRITTTLAKAKALRKYAEPLINRSKEDTTHSRRIVFRYLGNKEAVTELFQEVATKIADRPGGYTRILKTANRLGDNAEMCIIELVDYNENYTTGGKEEKTGRKKRRTRRGGSGSTTTTEAAAPNEENRSKLGEEEEPTQAEVIENQAEVEEDTISREEEISDIDTSDTEISDTETSEEPNNQVEENENSEETEENK